MEAINLVRNLSFGAFCLLAIISTLLPDDLGAIVGLISAIFALVAIVITVTFTDWHQKEEEF